MTFSIMTLSIITLSTVIKNWTLRITTHRIITHCTTLNSEHSQHKETRATIFNAEGHLFYYADCRYSECRYSECLGAVNYSDDIAASFAKGNEPLY
jgi:hypothetical protein